MKLESTGPIAHVTGIAIATNISKTCWFEVRCVMVLELPTLATLCENSLSTVLALLQQRSFCRTVFDKVIAYERELFGENSLLQLQQQCIVQFCTLMALMLR